MQLLGNFPRYLAAVQKRLEKLSYDPGRDEKQYVKLKPHWESYKKTSEYYNNSGLSGNELARYRYMLEEYRVSLFAQELGTEITVSPGKLLHQLNNIINTGSGSV